MVKGRLTGNAAGQKHGSKIVDIDGKCTTICPRHQIGPNSQLTANTIGHFTRSVERAIAAPVESEPIDAHSFGSAITDNEYAVLPAGNSNA